MKNQLKSKFKYGKPIEKDLVFDDNLDLYLVDKDFDSYNIDDLSELKQDERDGNRQDY